MTYVLRHVCGKKISVLYLTLCSMTRSQAFRLRAYWSDEELEDIEWEVKDEIVEPHNTGPAPSNAFDWSETPVSVHSNQCSYLHPKGRTVNGTYSGNWILSNGAQQEGREHTNCATKKANTNRKPGRSTNDQLRDLVTKMRAWLIVLTWRYTAEASFW